MNNIRIIMTAVLSLAVILCGCSPYDNSYDVSETTSESKFVQIFTYETYQNEIIPDSTQPIEITEEISIVSSLPEEIVQTTALSEKYEPITEKIIQKEVITEYHTEVPVIPELPQTQKETEVPVTETVPQTTSQEYVSVQHPEPNIYGYTPKFYQLTPEEQTAYDEIARGILLMENPIKISALINEEQLSKVYTAVITTVEQQLYNPVRKYIAVTNEYTGFIDSIKPVYMLSKTGVEVIHEELDEKANAILEQITPEMSDVDIVKLFHDSIILNCTYSFDEKNSSNAYGALVDGIAACEGYSRAMSYLCGKAGIPCEIITGTANNTYHMWNMVEIDGKWYHIDVTWDDPVLDYESPDYISYDYFNITDSKISQNHFIDTSMFSYPVAYSTDAEYYTYYSHTLTSLENTEDTIFNGIVSAVENGYNFAVFKSEDEATFNQITKFLFDDGWYQFFSIIDRYNSENEIQIDKSNIGLKKNTENFTIRISF